MAAALAKILLLIVLVFVLLAPSQPPPKGEEKAVFLSFSSPPLRGGAGGGAKELETRVIVIKDTSFTAELARTPLEQTRGLSGRAALAENRGMLFVLATSTRPAFWMKEMNLPIDIVWLENATGGYQHLSANFFAGGAGQLCFGIAGRRRRARRIESRRFYPLCFARLR